MTESDSEESFHSATEDFDANARDDAEPEKLFVPKPTAAAAEAKTDSAAAAPHTTEAATLTKKAEAPPDAAQQKRHEENKEGEGREQCRAANRRWRSMCSAAMRLLEEIETITT